MKEAEKKMRSGDIPSAAKSTRHTTTTGSYMKEKGVDAKGAKVCVCSGAAECRKALMLLKAGKLPEQFAEGMVCTDGCVGGPARQKSPAEFRKDRDAMIAKASLDHVHKNLEAQGADQVKMKRRQ